MLRWWFEEEPGPWEEKEHVFDMDTPALASSKDLWATSVIKKWGEKRQHLIKVARWGMGGWVREFRGHQFQIQSLAFSPDGRYLASGDENGDILIWDTQAPETGPNGVPADQF